MERREDKVEYWEDFERILAAFLRLAFYHDWDYPVQVADDADD